MAVLHHMLAIMCFAKAHTILVLNTQVVKAMALKYRGLRGEEITVTLGVYLFSFSKRGKMAKVHV